MTKTKTLHGILLFATLLANGALAAPSEEVLYSFTSADYQPGGVIFDAVGNLYGVSSNAGQYGHGRVFELSPSVSGWTEMGCTVSRVARMVPIPAQPKASFSILPATFMEQRFTVER